jgi:hypothetical protein
MKPLICVFLQLPDTSTLLGPDILSTLFSDVPPLMSGEHLSHEGEENAISNKGGILTFLKQNKSANYLTNQSARGGIAQSV